MPCTLWRTRVRPTPTPSMSMTDCPTLPTSLHFWRLIYFFTFTGEVWHIFSKSFDQLLEADGEDTNLVFSPTPSLLGDHCMRVLHLAEPNFAWGQQPKPHGYSPVGQKEMMVTGVSKNTTLFFFYQASIVYLLYIFLISATTLKHPKHDVELLEPRLQCSVHILDTSHHPHAGRWRCTLPCSPWRSSRKVPLPCFRSHEIDRRLSSHYIHKFKHIGNLESFIWLQVARLILLDLNFHIWPL